MKGLVLLPYVIIEKEKLVQLAGEAKIVICADGGAKVAFETGIDPDVLIGDFDSIDQELLLHYTGSDTELVRLEKEKDLTDGEAAVIECLKRGCTEITICAPGFMSETDHLLGNILLMNKYPNCRLVNEHESMFIASESKIKLFKNRGEEVSIVPLEKSEMILDGFKYSGKMSVNLGDTLTLRNLLLDDIAEISLLQGKLLIIQRFRKNSMI